MRKFPTLLVSLLLLLAEITVTLAQGVLRTSSDELLVQETISRIIQSIRENKPHLKTTIVQTSPIQKLPLLGALLTK